MKQFLILLFVILGFNAFSQIGFNKTYYIYSPLSSGIKNIVRYDTSYFISGITYLSTNTNIQNVFYSNLTNLGNTFNLHVINDTNYYQWGDLNGNIVKLNSNSFYQAVSVFKLDTSPILKQVLLFKFNGQDTIWTNICISDTLDREEFDITYLDGYFYLTGAIELPGYTYYDIMLLKTDSLGNLIWMKHFGNDKAIGYQIVSTFDHKIMIAAHYYDYLGTNQSQWYIMKLDTAGNIIWTHDYGNPTLNDYMPRCLLETSDSNYIITGSYGIEHTYVNPNNPDANTRGRFLKISPNGSVLIDKLLGKLANSAYTSIGIIKEKPNKNYITIVNNGFIVGQTQSAYNPILVELTPDAQVCWFRYYYYNNSTAVNNAIVESLEFTSEGGYIFAGYGTDNNITPAQRGWFVKTDSLGFDGVSTMGIDTAYRIEHIADTCYGDTAIVYTHLFGVTAPYSISYEGFENHDSLYYSPELTYNDESIKDSLIITSATYTGSDSLIDIICHVTDGLGRTLTDTIHANVACLVSGTETFAFKNSIRIYPNPADAELIIEYSILENFSTDCSIGLYDTKGKLVKSVPINAQTGIIKLDISDIANGNYVISVCNFGNKDYNKQISIVH